MAAEVLTRRALNRALLGRQLLLERSGMSVRDAVEHLVGMQAQVPTDPYYGLWSRLDGFEASALGDLVESGELVRANVMRCTIHLMSARDCLYLRAAMGSVVERACRNPEFERNAAGLDLEAVKIAGRELLEERPRTRAELGRDLAERWPGHAPDVLSRAAIWLVPMLQVPPRGVWGKKLQTTFAPIDSFLGRPLAADDDPAEAVLRYLRAFGPAAPKDVRTWSYKTGLREVIDRLRPDLVAYRDENGTELLDVPDGLFPEPDTPAPPRFLPEFDNALLSHDDRARIIPPPSGQPWWRGSILVDGFVAGTWRLERDKEYTDTTTTLRLLPHGSWKAGDRREVLAEAERLLAFASDGEGAQRVEVGES